jgi:hypothetical protein
MRSQEFNKNSRPALEVLSTVNNGINVKTSRIQPLIVYMSIYLLLPPFSLYARKS